MARTWEPPAPGPVRAEGLLASPGTLVFRDDLPGGGTVHQWRCDHYPRALKQVYRGNRTAPVVTTWIVDGVRCADIGEAIHVLNGPAITEDEVEVGAGDTMERTFDGASVNAGR